MPKTATAKSAAAALVIFLVSQAWLAFAYRPAVSDTVLYSLYAFLISDARRVGESPYDHFERLRRKSAEQHGLPSPSPDQTTLEYPPLALELMLAPLPFVSKNAAGMRGLGAHDAADWTNGFRLLYFLAHASVMASLLWWLRRRGFASSWGLLGGTLAGIVLAYVLYDRLDLWLGLVLVAALSALVTGHRYVACVLLAVAVNLKVVPVLLVPLFALGALPARVSAQGLLSRRTLAALALAGAVFAATCLAVFLPFRLAWGPRVWDFLSYHSQRGFQVESTWSSILLVAAQLGYPAQLIHEFGADDVVGPGTGLLAKVSSLVTLAAVALAYGFVWRAVRRRQTEAGVDSSPAGTLAEQDPQLFVWGTFAVLALAMATSKVFSPQYLCWFPPMFLLARHPKNGRAAAPLLVFLLACGLTTVVFPNLWPEVIRAVTVDGNLALLLPTSRSVLVMLARNLVWIGFCALAIAQLRATSPPPQAAAPSKPSRGRRHGRRR